MALLLSGMRMSVQAELDAFFAHLEQQPSCYAMGGFKRLKHRLNLEHVSGLSQQAVVQDVAAKILTDNLYALSTSSAGAT